jgi:2-amino-4-hydroxy-6-hydroxymethyldihydropteridine diphosphokinase
VVDEGRTAFIALGANLGDRLATLQEATRRLREIGPVEAESSVYETEPVGFLEQPRFLNAVVQARTALPPEDIVRRLLAIESAMGRTRSFRNAPRTIDLDLLLLGDETRDEPGVTLPHPRLQERAFVLAPLAEIAPEARVPGLGRTAAELLAALDPAARAGVRRLDGVFLTECPHPLSRPRGRPARCGRRGEHDGYDCRLSSSPLAHRNGRGAGGEGRHGSDHDS